MYIIYIYIYIYIQCIVYIAILSENATLLSENYSYCKCFGFHVLIICTATTNTQINREEKLHLIKFHTELKNGLGKMIGTLLKL